MFHILIRFICFISREPILHAKKLYWLAGQYIQAVQIKFLCILYPSMHSTSRILFHADNVAHFLSKGKASMWNYVNSGLVYFLVFTFVGSFLNPACFVLCGNCNINRYPKNGALKIPKVGNFSDKDGFHFIIFTLTVLGEWWQLYMQSQYIFLNNLHSKKGLWLISVGQIHYRSTHGRTTRAVSGISTSTLECWIGERNAE